METVFSFIPAGWKATSPDTIEQCLDNGGYAYVHKYPDAHGRTNNNYCWQVSRAGMHISGLVTDLHAAIDSATLFLNGPLDVLRTRYQHDAQDRISRLHRQLADLHKKLAAVGIANPDTLYDQAYKAGYDAGIRDEHAAVIELLDQRVPA